MQRMPLGVLLAVGDDLKDRLARIKKAGFATIQLVSPPARWLDEARRKELKQVLADSGLRVTSVAAVYEGEDYRDIAAVRTTVGLLPEKTRAERVEYTKRTADFAHEVGCPNVSSHIGYIPEDRAGSEYGAMVAAVQEICDYLHRRRMSFCLETGQETAGLLNQFITDTGRDNLKVNFDPANMVAYGTGDPVAALEELSGHVRGVHVKDAVGPKAAGALGAEVPLGEGEVGLERFLAKLKQLDYQGPLTIEREVPGEQQMQGFLSGKKLLDELKSKLGIG